MNDLYKASHPNRKLLGIVLAVASFGSALAQAKWVDIIPNWFVASVWIASGWGFVYLGLTSHLARARYSTLKRWRKTSVAMFMIVGAFLGGLSGVLMRWAILRDYPPQKQLASANSTNGQGEPNSISTAKESPEEAKQFNSKPVTQLPTSKQQATNSDPRLQKQLEELSRKVDNIQPKDRNHHYFNPSIETKIDAQATGTVGPPKSPRTSSPTLVQQGTNNISQIGDNNVATINPEVNPNAPVITYDFNGAKRITSPGRSIAEAGDQFSAFQIMSEMERGQKWQELSAKADEQIKVAPHWLTPYIFKAEALASLGQRDEAVKLCQYVKTKSGGNPQFDGVTNKLLNLLNQQ